MDIPVFIALVILFVICILEVFFLLRCPKIKQFPVYLLISLYGSDEDIEQILSYTIYLLSNDTDGFRRVFLLYEELTDSQKMLCEKFCSENTSVYLVKTENIENFLPKIIDFNEKI
ncbi:MAG: hypothetical protein MJ081_00085 [Ruminococcus sp.]|nr:hypothetical protein [Ruminococcus sp.]